MASKTDTGGWIFKGGIFALLAGLAFWLFNKKTDNASSNESVATQESPAPNQPEALIIEWPDFLPAENGSQRVAHRYFWLGYNEDHEQAEWVAYELTRARLNENWADRGGMSFKPDPEVRTESATPRDYTGSGYDRGHLCAAADMSFDTLALSETFYMSNISPQIGAFNAGIWRELEELTRDWARQFKHIYVVTGPVLTRKSAGQIGFSKVTVPAAFYKVIYAPDQHKAIGFIIPNAVSEKHVMDYAFEINYVEQMTGLDFFPQLLKGLDEELEGSLDRSAWKVDERRFEKRVKEWNN